MGVAKLDGLTSWAYTVGPIAALVSPLFLGLIADRFFPTQRVLGVMHLLGGAALIAIPRVIPALDPKLPQTFFHPYVLLLLAHMLCYMPTLGLTNTLCFHNMTRPERQFPIVRVFGTIGWIVGTIVVSGNLKDWGLDVTWIPDGDKSPLQFYIAGTAGILLGLYSFGLPHTPPPAAGKKARLGEMLGLDSLKLLKDWNYLVFVICSFLVCIPLAAYYNQGRNFVEFAGFRNPTFTMAYGQFSEIFFMLAMPLFFARLGVKWMLAAGMLAWAVRYGLFSGAAHDKVAWMVVLGILLHGICYDFFFVTGFLYVDRKAPREIRGQAQGFLVLITQGLGLGVGARVIGEVVGKHTSGEGSAKITDWHGIWLFPCLFAAGVLVLFVALFWDRTSRPAQQQS
jgi:nucleoside transporter